MASNEEPRVNSVPASLACTNSSFVRSAGLSLMLAAASLLPAGALAQGPALEPDVAARELRACDAAPPSPYGGRALWNPNLWTGGIVPYQFDANTTPGDQTAMRTAMNALESVAAVHFVVRSNQANYLAIRDANGNNS